MSSRSEADEPSTAHYLTPVIIHGNATDSVYSFKRRQTGNRHERSKPADPRQRHCSPKRQSRTTPHMEHGGRNKCTKRRKKKLNKKQTKEPFTNTEEHQHRSEGGKDSDRRDRMTETQTRAGTEVTCISQSVSCRYHRFRCEYKDLKSVRGH